MSEQVDSGTRRMYPATGHDTLLSEVRDVHCILMPRALLITGFSQEGRILMARYNSYDRELPGWNAGFFEQEFGSEPMLRTPGQVKAIFIGSREELLIPNDLYQESAARKWMESLQAICPDDVLYGYDTRSADAQYAFALPAAMDKLLHRYFGDTRIIPLAAYQFHKPAAGVPNLFQCLIAQDTVIATLHQGGKLFWHQHFSYQTAEDIAWQVASLCRELSIPRVDLTIECTTLCDDCYDLGPELERYFPKIRWSVGSGGDGPDAWAPVVYLAQQLYACAL